MAAVTATFGVSLWLARSASFGWMPQEEADRWVEATAFATVVTGAVGAATSRWAGLEEHPSAEPQAGRTTSEGAEPSRPTIEVSHKVDRLSGGRLTGARHAPVDADVTVNTQIGEACGDGTELTGYDGRSCVLHRSHMAASARR